MKKLFLLCLVTMTVNSYAMIINPPVPACVFPSSGEITLEAACYIISTTTSLPTLIVEGVEIDLNSPEAQERLEAEMRGDIEPILLNQLQNIQGE